MIIMQLTENVDINIIQQCMFIKGSGMATLLTVTCT